MESNEAKATQFVEGCVGLINLKGEEFLANSLFSQGFILNWNQRNDS